MKIIITENQYKNLKILIESNNPCPSGTKVSKLITLDDVKNGTIIPKGYCNSSSGSAIVKIQKMLKNKKLLDSGSPEGYYGDKTQQAVKDLFKPMNVVGDKIGPKTVSELEKSGDKKEKETKKPEDLFNKLTYDQKVLVCTLLGEAGGEQNPKRDMTAVANVLKNRAKENHMNKGGMVGQALAPYQFSMWNGKKVETVFNELKKHSQMQTAIDIVKNIDSLSDNTGGALFYYASWMHKGAEGVKNSSCGCLFCKAGPDHKWVDTTQIGKHKFGNYVKKVKKKK